MSAKKTGLGRSFNSLIPTEFFDESFDPTADQDDRVSDLRYIRLEEITPDPDQPRRTFDELSLSELTTSIRDYGVLQPIVVRPHQGNYMIVAGERRFRAAKLAGLTKIPALVRTLSNQHKLELSLIENLQRSDLNPLETATAYLKLRDQFNLTLDQIGERVGGKSVSTISNTLRLLRLPAMVREALADGRLSEGRARPLVNLDEATIESILPRMIAEDWSARMTEQYISRLKSHNRVTSGPAASGAETVASLDAAASRLQKRFKVPVKIKATPRGAGSITIAFKNHNEFKRLTELLDSSSH
ncbi:chromosome-partitioning protein parB [Candidatus Saccharimonas aalborgensis]|uniref:Chromosome-partitioning protein parB n=1 Tax=Candidatus Saccharimonas aalborgensis TaxID=1332188 RepID=R4PYW8_9BACT|nr:ParB/RepB/Spo0J family partition protein [Candidatus Saccharimonas aalborgensis]AGL62436.1 chromosome-partitioning protein parB [Candidatus Saccharimonas aalborgensis]QQS67939.1 MAG: ParB/RepB/Spo0J family partition protein [Candidatus Saccharibacteria bacterium]